MEFRRRQRIRRVLLSRGTMVLLLVVAAFLARGVWNLYQKNEDTKERLAQAQYEYAQLEAQRQFLEEDNARLHTEEGIEEEIRENFSLGKEGERAIIVVAPEAGTATTSGEKAGWWQRVKDFFTRN